MPGVGPARRQSGGPGLEVRLPGGAAIPTHGSDVAAPVGVPSNTNTSYPAFETLAQPVCASNARVELIYFRASDIADHYSAYAPNMRTTLRQINEWLRQRGLETSNNTREAKIRTRCQSGTIQVHNAGVSAQTVVSSTYQNVVNELRAKGYKSSQSKYLILFDTGDCKPTGTGSCYTGVGSWWNDPTRSTTNPANQPYSNSYPGYAIVWGPRWFYQQGTTALHELLHTMGAVNTLAPNATGAAHCWDDLDPMCYADGGTNAPGAVFTACSTAQLDCGADSYFNISPAAGTWLATNWQPGWTGNRFLSFPTL